MGSTPACDGLGEAVLMAKGHDASGQSLKGRRQGGRDQFQFMEQIDGAELNQSSIVRLEGPLLQAEVDAFTGTEEVGGFWSHRGGHI
jgi:hypothetical protein